MCRAGILSGLGGVGSGCRNLGLGFHWGDLEEPTPSHQDSHNDKETLKYLTYCSLSPRLQSSKLFLNLNFISNTNSIQIKIQSLFYIFLCVKTKVVV